MNNFFWGASFSQPFELTQKLLLFKNLKKNKNKKIIIINFQKKKEKKKLDSLLTALEDGENYKLYYSFVALSSKKLSKNKRTDGQTDGRKLQKMYMICIACSTFEGPIFT
jgi:hypothetical protein